MKLRYGLRLAAVAAGTAAVGVAMASPSFASTPPPGGYNTVVAVVSVQSSGGTKSGQVGHDTVSVAVPAGAFSAPVQLVITSPNLAAIPASNSGTVALAGVGLTFERQGVPLPSVLPSGIVVTITGANIPSGATVVDLQSGSAVPVVANVTAGSASLTLKNNGSDLAVFGYPTAAGTPTAAPTAVPTAGPSSPTDPGAAISGATTAQTGKPFLGEGVAAGVLILGGVALAKVANPSGRSRRRELHG